MIRETLTIALLTEVFHDDPEDRLLRSILEEARQKGAELAALPELPRRLLTKPSSGELVSRSRR